MLRSIAAFKKVKVLKPLKLYIFPFLRPFIIFFFFYKYFRVFLGQQHLQQKRSIHIKRYWSVHDSGNIWKTNRFLVSTEWCSTIRFGMSHLVSKNRPKKNKKRLIYSSALRASVHYGVAYAWTHSPHCGHR